MFRDKTTFVIGAGASAEFGLPVGSGLAKNIRNSALLRPNVDGTDWAMGDKDFAEKVAAEYRDNLRRRECLAALRAINEGIYTATSIDAFIHRHQSNVYIQQMGKALIAWEIAKAERVSNMRMHGELGRDGASLDKEELEDKWIGHFFRILSDGVSDPQSLGYGVSIICFNYDRCIEYYLIEAIHKAYRIDRAEAKDIVNRLNIIHPYGTLGRVPYQTGGWGDRMLEFGPDPNFDPFTVGQNIRTYTEQMHKEDEVSAIHEAIYTCNNLIFLGFGFNNQNLDLLRIRTLPNYLNPKPRNIYTTGVGIYPQVNDTLTRRILDLFVDRKKHEEWKTRVHIENGQGCKELFSIHGMNFSSFIQHVVNGDQMASVKGERLSRVGED
jgi:hypothetical protein